MPSPLLTGVDPYLPAAWPDGWAMSRTLSTPSFSAATCVVWIAADWVTFDADPGPVQWQTPAGWTELGAAGNLLFSGFGSKVSVLLRAYQCPRSAVAGVVSPRKGDGTPYAPSNANSFWRVFVSGWSVAKAPSFVRARGTNATQNPTPPNTAVPSPWLLGNGDGTFVQMTVGTYGFGGGPFTVNTANGYTLAWTLGTYPEAALAYKTFSGIGVTTPPIYYNKIAVGGFRLGATLALSLDDPMRRGGHFRGRQRR